MSTEEQQAREEERVKRYAYAISHAAQQGGGPFEAARAVSRLIEDDLRARYVEGWNAGAEWQAQDAAQQEQARQQRGTHGTNAPVTLTLDDGAGV